MNISVIQTVLWKNHLESNPYLYNANNHGITMTEVKTRNGNYYDVPRLEDTIRLIFKDRPFIMLLTKPRSDFVPVGVMYFSDSNPVMCEHFERVEDIRKQVKTDGVTIRFSRKPVFNTESYLKFILKSTRH
ncbi:unnamed protein product [Clavelina lepadiformis]|uniref:Uncharacterized protein n=1 Tax=Clavelina lepadiformis TaxID=159417 RepID=A0ABP0G2B5_CLALP